MSSHCVAAHTTAQLLPIVCPSYCPIPVVVSQCTQTWPNPRQNQRLRSSIKSHSFRRKATCCCSHRTCRTVCLQRQQMTTHECSGHTISKVVLIPTLVCLVLSSNDRTCETPIVRQGWHKQSRMPRNSSVGLS